MSRFIRVAALLLASVVAIPLWAQTALRPGPAVSFDRILNADREPQNWLTYSGTVSGHRHSRLAQITPENVQNLELAWIWQSLPAVWATEPGQTKPESKFEPTPLVVDGVMYTVQAPNDVVALDAVTGRLLWTYPYKVASPAFLCCGDVNRGLAILGDILFLGTIDAHLVAIDARTGRLVWNTVVADAQDPACRQPEPYVSVCYAITLPPLVVHDKVIVGTAGGDTRPGSGTRGFVAAFDVKTGKELWRFSTIPAPGEPGHETWSGDSWKTGGAAVWNAGSYDPVLNLTYWGTGNPSPPRDGSGRLGDNLYSNSVIALDADSGTLRWHYQFNPHDERDWDAAQVPVLTDLVWQGRQRKVMLWANKNGLMYVIDRTTGEWLTAKAFVAQNWMTGFDGKGRPIPVPGNGNTPVLPVAGTNWYPPSYSPETKLFYIPALELPSRQGVIQAVDPTTGDRKWEFELAWRASGVLTTASNLLFGGVYSPISTITPSVDADPVRLVDGYFFALDARSGRLLWKMSLGGNLQSGPISYSVNGRQYVAVAAGRSLFAFALRQ
jgi:alcohol dehydrogenase (cytochrome c)